MGYKGNTIGATHIDSIIEVLRRTNNTEARLMRLYRDILNPSCIDVVTAIFAKIGECFDDIDRIIEHNIKAVEAPGRYGPEIERYQWALQELEKKYEW